MNTNSYLKKLQDRLIETFFKYKKALNALDDVIERLRHTEDKDLFPYFRDSLIQRFEFSVELLWKLLKVYLEYFYGIQCNSPKGCVKEAYKV
jgi:nucleotidyltransferase substrate binding protein (TIGR01987 family)